MKFLRFFVDNMDDNKDSTNNGPKTGYFDGEKVVELSDSIINVLNNWETEGYIEDNMVYSYSIEDITFAPPCEPTKIICVGLNYKDHSEELSMELPNEPKIFLKPPSSVIACGEDIVYPKMSNEVDYEAELSIVISKVAKNIGNADDINIGGIGDIGNTTCTACTDDSNSINDCIGGYTILNDVTARDLQREDEQWTRAKSFDTFAPIGPFIETDMDPNNQNISLSLNGDVKQSSNTKNMIFSTHELVKFISNIMTLNPGDIIATGTPSGIGHMKKGDIVEIAIDDIGVLKNRIV